MSEHTDLMTFEDAAQELGITLRSVRRLVRLGRLPSEPIGRHPNGKVAHGIPRSTLSLSKDLVCVAQPPSAVRNAPIPDRVPLTHDGLPDVAAMRALGLDSHADEWDRRMRIVAEYSDLRIRAPHGGKRAAAQLVAQKYSESLSTIYRYWKDWREGGPAALLPAWQTQAGRTTLPADLQCQVREFWLNSRRASVAQVYKSVVLPYYKDINTQPPHRSTIARFLRKHVLPLEKTFWREGRRAYQAQAAPKVVRALPTEPNDWWCADHRLWDVMVVVPDGRGAGWGRHDKLSCPCGSGRERRRCCSVRRPWLTMIVDIASAAFVGYRISLVPTAAGVCHAIRSAILDYGVPRHFYRDNGREFTARRLGGRADRLLKPRRTDLESRQQWPCAVPADVEQSGVWSALGVEVVTALPYHPWSKPIESIFHAFSQQWENLVPGWSGRDAKQKPEALDSQIRSGSLLLLDEFAQVFAQELAKWHADHVCGERAQTPDAFHADYLPRAVDPATLTFLIQDVRERVHVEQSGIFLQAGGTVMRFWTDDLALYIGCVVTVRWDPDDPRCIWAYTPDKKVVAVPPATDAEWGAWGEPNAASKRAERIQRNFLKARASEMRGATPIERLDPVGAVALIRDRQAGIAESAVSRSAADERLRELADEQQRALEDAKSKKPEKYTTVYDDELSKIA